MARVVLSALLVSLTGKYGGGIFRNWKGLTVLGMVPNHVHNPNTAKQAAVREIFSYITKQWRTLTVGERAGWSAVAEYLTDIGSQNLKSPRDAAHGLPEGRGPYTPIGAMIAIHANLHSVDLWDVGDALLDPPVGRTNPSPPNLTLVNRPVADITVTWTDPGDWGSGGHAGGIQIWAQTQDAVFFPQQSGFTAGAVETYVIPGLVPRGGIDLTEMEVGELLEVSVRGINDFGIASAWSENFQWIIDAAP